MAGTEKLEECKQYLRAVPENGGVSLYDHMTQVLVKLIHEKPSDANIMFEDLSAAVRASTYAPPPPPAVRLVDAEEAEDVGPARAAQRSWATSQTTLFETRVGDDEAEDDPEVKFPDLSEAAAQWQWGGVSLGEEETYRLQLSLKRLALDKRTKVRFWGKLFTRDGDYLLAETPTPEEASPAASPEERLLLEGLEGPNKYTYWASKNTGDTDEWTQLPHVTPGHIVGARKVRRFLTGSLSAPVASYPGVSGGALGKANNGDAAGAVVYEADGTEAHLVRAMVAMITADCVLSLDGQLEEGEMPGGGEDGEEMFKTVQPVEEDPDAPPEGKAYEDLKEAGTWVHAELDINTVGRTQPTPGKGEDEEPDPEPLAPLRPITEDAGDEEGAPAAWQVKGNGPQSCIALKSLKWPGALAVCRTGGTSVSNVYVGFGLPSSMGKSYTPPMPPKILAEWPKGGGGGEGEEEEAGEDGEAPMMKEQPDVKADPTVVEEGEEDE